MTVHAGLCMHVRGREPSTLWVDTGSVGDNLSAVWAECSTVR